MYEIHMVTDNQKLKGDINLVQELVECYDDNPSHFIDACLEMEVGKRMKVSDHLQDYMIVTKIS